MAYGTSIQASNKTKLGPEKTLLNIVIHDDHSNAQA
jgi:hypothetical protein